MAETLADQFTPAILPGQKGRLGRNIAIGLTALWALASYGLYAAGVPPLTAIFTPAAKAVTTVGQSYATIFKAIPGIG